LHAANGHHVAVLHRVEVDAIGATRAVSRGRRITLRQSALRSLSVASGDDGPERSPGSDLDETVDVAKDTAE